MDRRDLARKRLIRTEIKFFYSNYNSIMHMETLEQKEHWIIIYNWLKQCGSSPNKNFCREEITTHPDYPSLLSVVDFLESGGMAYQAVKADASYITEFNYPLLAHIKQPDNEYMQIISNAGSWDQQKELTKYWSGIVVYPEKDAIWQSSENEHFRQEAKRNKFIAVFFIFFGLVIYIYPTYFGLVHLMFETIAIPFWGFFGLVGFVISIYALGTELGFQSQVVKQLCGAVGSSDSCEQVLKSKYSKGFLGITPASASVVYFASQFVMYILCCWQPVFFPVILLFSLSGIFISMWSIYTQTIKLKQLCALCLGVVAVLVLQLAIALLTIIDRSLRNWVLTQQSNFLNSACLFAAFFIVFCFILLPIKQLAKTNGINKNKLAEFKKWKMDVNLFMEQWQQEQEINMQVLEGDLFLGNPNAPLIIIIACNPYCGPCAKEHMQLDELLNKYNGKLKVIIRFLCQPDDENSKITVAVKAILQKANDINNSIELQSMLKDWFTWMDYGKWVEKWHPNKRVNVRLILKQNQQWAEHSKISFTPTLFLNGKRLPRRYSLEDLGLLIPQLEVKVNSIST